VDRLSQSGHFGEEKTLLPLPGIKLQFLSLTCSLVSKHTELSLNTTVIMKTKYKMIE